MGVTDMGIIMEKTIWYPKKQTLFASVASQSLCKPSNRCKIKTSVWRFKIMARKNDSPQKAAMRKMMQEYLKNNDINIKSGTDVNSVMREMMSVLLEGALDEELNEELGYSKYDYKNKNKDNSRNGHSQKTMHTSYGDMDISIPRDRNGEYEPQLVKKYQNTVTQDMEEKIISM